MISKTDMNLLNGFRNGTVYLSPVSMRTIAALVNSIAVAPVLKGFNIFQSHLSFKSRNSFLWCSIRPTKSALETLVKF
jgi:hypothetical protein